MRGSQHRTRKIVPLLLTLFAFQIAALCGMAQRPAKPSPLVGTWSLVSVDNVKPDGSRTPRHGSHPAGLLIFDDHGRYSLIVLTEGTPDEYKSALEGNNADYGRYTVNEAEHTVTFYMDHASHPELEGSSHTRFYRLDGDRLIYTTVRLPAGAKSAATYGEVVLQRAK